MKDVFYIGLASEMSASKMNELAKCETITSALPSQYYRPYRLTSLLKFTCVIVLLAAMIAFLVHEIKTASTEGDFVRAYQQKERGLK